MNSKQAAHMVGQIVIEMTKQGASTWEIEDRLELFKDWVNSQFEEDEDE